jgi:poly(A)-specific ribonuclease
MEVTRLNYAQVLPRLLADIRSATFLVYDMEQTGIAADRRLQNTSIDTLQHRYLKLRRSISSFYPLQFGLCTFHQVEDHFQVRPYSVYLFPRGTNERHFLMQSGSVEFLSEHKLDFNKAFYTGLNYFNAYDKYLLRTKHPETHSHLLRTAYLDTKEKVERQFTGHSMQLDVGVLTASEVLYIQSELEREKGLKASQVKTEGPSRTFRIEPKASASDDDFSKVVLAMQGKPLVGHNMIMDALHIYDKFIEPLPSSLETFRQRFGQYFPEVYDTKHIVQSSAVLQQAFQVNRDTSLQACYAKLGELSFPSLPIVSETHVEAVDHDAVYDAYCTGVLLIRSAQLLGLDVKHLIPSLGLYKNFIPVAGRRPSLNLSSQLPEESREDIFAVTRIPKSLSHEALQQQLTGRFGPVALYKIFWTDETVYVCPSSIESRDKMLAEVQSIQTLETAGGQVWLCRYKDFLEIESKDY